MIQAEPNKVRPKTIAHSYATDTGRTKHCEVNLVIDVRDYVGTPGYALLLVAANTHLPVSAVLYFLWATVPSRFWRSRTWIMKRRWLFQKPDAVNSLRGLGAGIDGRHSDALRIMGLNPELSVRNLSLFLEDHGIYRSREWVRKHRCDSLLTTTTPINKD